MTYAGTVQALRTSTGLNKSASYLRAYMRWHVDTNPSSIQEYATWTWSVSGGGSIANIRTKVATNGALSLQLYNATTSAQIGSDYSISADTWYRIEGKLIVSATVGELELLVDGVSRAAGTGLNTGSTNTDFIQLKCWVTSGGLTIYYDDVRFDDAAYPGAYVSPIAAMRRRSTP